MTNSPLVSIVTPSYNQSRFLEETILSVLFQDYPNIEYIVIDGGSTDGSLEIIKKYADRLAYWVSEKDQGQTDALIKGFEHAHGELLGWLCSDDVLEPSMVRFSVAFLSKYPAVCLTFGDRTRIDAHSNITCVQRYPEMQPYHLRWGLTLPQVTVLFRRAAYQAAGGLDASLHMAMDYDLWCRLNHVAPFKHIPAYLGRFRSYPDNKSARFSQQMENFSFSGEYTSEFSKLHQKYFGAHASLRMMQLGNLLRRLQGLLERRTAAYRRDLALINAIRSE